MEQVSLGRRIKDILHWVSQKLKDTLTQWKKRMKLSSPQKKSKLAKHLEIIVDDDLKTLELEGEEYISFAVGDKVRFANLISDNYEDWGMTSIVEFKILKGHMGMIGTILEMRIKEYLPVDFNLFMSVRFDDGYVADDVTHFAFEPLSNSYGIIDFEKEKARILKERENEIK